MVPRIRAAPATLAATMQSSAADAYVYGFAHQEAALPGEFMAEFAHHYP